MRKLTFLPLIAVAALMLVWLPASAGAEAPSGSPLVTIPVGSKGKGLRAGGAKVTAFGGGLVRSDAVALAVSDISIAGTNRVNLVLRGGVKVKQRGRTLTIRGFFVQVASRSVSVTARIGGKRIQLLSAKLKPSAEFDAARFSVKFSAQRSTLSSKAIKSIRSKLPSFKPRSRSLGKLAGSAFAIAPPQTGAVITPGEASACKPVAGPSTDPAKPATAIDLSCGYVILHTRDSWTSYVEVNYPIEPAAGLPAISGNDHVCKDGGTPTVDVYSYSLPVQSGWWDAASGRGYIKSSGGVQYLSDERGINVKLYDLEIEINGSASKTYMVTTESDNPTPTRIPFATIDPAAPVAGAVPGPGAPLTRLRQIMTVEAIGGPFGWMYSQGSGFGCVDFGFNF